MPTKQRNLKLKITGDTSDVNKQINSIRKTAKTLGVTLTKELKVASDQGKKLAATLTLTTAQLSKLAAVQNSISPGKTSVTSTQSRDFASEEKSKESAIIASEKEKTRIRNQAAANRLRKAKEVNNEILGITKTSVSNQNSIIRNGVNSKAAILTKGAAQQKAIVKKLQKDLNNIAKKAQSGLSGAALNSSRTKAQTTAQKALNASYKQTQTALSGLPAKLQKVNDGHKSWIRHVTEIVGLYRLVNFGINSTLEGIKAIPKIGIELQTTQAVLESTLGSSAASAGAFKFLNTEAERVGQNVLTIRENFRNLNASMSLAGENTQTVVDVFSNLNTVTTALHLSQAKTQDVFLAISQIFNKTKVQSEELVKQLGNLLPGAFASFAAATGRSTKQLVDEMQQGLVFAHDNVVEFTKFLADRFSAGFAIAQVGLQANIGRMQTAFIELGETIFKSLEEPLIESTKKLKGFAEILKSGVNIIQEFSTLISAVLVFSFTKLVISLTGATAGLLTLTTATTTYTGAAALAARTSAFWASSLAFLAAPATIIAGAAAIAFAISRIGKDTSDAREKLKELIAEREKFLRDSNKKPEKLSIDIEIDNAPKIQELNEILNKTADEAGKVFIKLEKTKNSSSGFNAALRKSLEERYKILLAEQRKGENLLSDLREEERAKILLEKQKQAEREAELDKTLQGLLKQGNNESKSKKSKSSKIISEEQYQQTLKQTEIIILELEGKEKQASLAKLALQRQTTLAKLKGADQETKSLRDRFIATQKLQEIEIQSKFNAEALLKIKAELSTQESLLNAQQGAGLLTEIQAFDKIQEKRLEAISSMRDMIFLQEQQALTSGRLTEKQIETFAKAKEEIDLLYLRMVDGAKRPEQAINIMGENIRGNLETNLGESFVGFISGAKSASDAMTDFATNVLDQISRIASQKLAAQIIGGIIGGIGKAFNSPAFGDAGNSAGFSDSISNAFTQQAKGGINKGLSGAANTILTKPTIFPNAVPQPIPFAKGGVLAGEAGVEAVLPLGKTSSGELGVKTVDSSTKNSGNTFNISVSVQGDKNDSPEDTGNKIAISVMRNIAKEEIFDAKRSGNQLNKITEFG